LSYPVLKAFIQLKNHRFPKKEDILESIRDTKPLDFHFPPGANPAKVYEVFDRTYDDAEDRETNEIAKVLQSTMVIVELVRTLHAWNDVSVAEKKLKQALIVQEFEAATGWSFPSGIYDVTNVPATTLAADKTRGEHDLETYNRAIQLMKSMFRTCFRGVWGPRYGPDRKVRPIPHIRL